MMTDPDAPTAATASSSAHPQLLVRMITFDQQEPTFTIASNYLEMFWQSVLGPTSTALIRYIARCEVSHGSDPDTPYTPIDPHALCVSLGIHKKGNPHDDLPRAFNQTIERLARLRFLIIDQHEGQLPTHISVRSHVGLVPSKFRDGWPEILRERHRSFVDSTVTGEPHNEVR